MDDLSSFLVQAQHVRELLERGRYSEARLVNFQLVCSIRRAILEPLPHEVNGV